MTSTIQATPLPRFDFSTPRTWAPRLTWSKVIELHRQRMNPIWVGKPRQRKPVTPTTEN